MPWRGSAAGVVTVRALLDNGGRSYRRGGKPWRRTRLRAGEPAAAPGEPARLARR